MPSSIKLNKKDPNYIYDEISGIKLVFNKTLYKENTRYFNGLNNLLTISDSCFFSKKGTPWCLTTFLKEQFVTIKEKKIIYNILIMNEKYIHIYNNLINYTRNKDLYKSLCREDSFSDRLTLFLLHFSL